MSHFKNENTTLEHLIENKKPDCVTALEAGYRQAVNEGLGFRQAYYKAEVIHFLQDHAGTSGLIEPRLTIPETDEAVRDAIVEDANTEKEVAIAHLLLTWYDLVRSWGADVALSFSTAIQASQEEWEDENDLDEAEGIKVLNKIPDEEIKDVTLTAFYSSRNKGASVYASLRAAKDAAERTTALSQFLSLMRGLDSDEGSFLN